VNQQEPPRPARSARPGRQEVWTLTLTSAALFMSGLDNLVVITALPTIRTHFHATLPQLEWTVNAYTLTFAVLLLTGAALGDRFGRRRVLICGIATFTAGSLTAALATTSAALIAARALQGCGAAALLPLTLTVLTEAIPAQRRAVALGVWSGVNGLAVALGPVIGGFIIVHATWQWIFLVNVPVGLALLPLIRLRLAESHGPNDRLDLTGTALVSAALLGIVYALVSGNQDGWGSPRVLGPALGGAFLLGAFSGWETRTRAPMVPLRLYRSRTFSIANAVSLLAFLGIFGSIFLLTQYLQGIEDYSPYAAGIRTLPWTAMPILVAPLGGLIAARIGAKPVVTSGLTCMTGGLAWFAAAIHLHTPYTAMITPMALCGIGMSLYFAPSLTWSWAPSAPRTRAWPPASATPSANSAASSASPFSPQSSPQTAAWPRHPTSPADSPPLYGPAPLPSPPPPSSCSLPPHPPSTAHRRPPPATHPSIPTMHARQLS
jgi:EmrB/QacA subfamily drug resistance transporter